MSRTAEEIYEQMRRQQEEQAQQLRLNVGNEVAPDYDKATRIFAVEARTQLPYQVVEADLPNLEDKLRRDDFDSRRYTDAENGSPFFNDFAGEHPYHPAVLDRDWENLTGIERAWQQIELGWDSGRAMGEIEEIRSRQLDNFENPNQEKDKARLEQLDQLLEGGMFGADAWYTKTLVGTAQQLPIQAWLVAESLDEIAIGAGVGVAYGAATGGGAVATGLFGAGRGFLVGRTEAAFRLERALAYHEYLGMGLNEEEARWAATAVGSVNAALESIGLGALTKRIPGFKQIQNDAVGAMINSVLRKTTMKHAIARASLMYGEGVATELLTEILQETTLIMAGEMLKSYERDRGNLDPTLAPITVGVPFTASSGEFWDRVGDTAAHTLYGVALIAGGGPMSSYVGDTIKIRTAERRLAAYEAMGDAAEKSETRKNAPTKYEEFVNKLVGKEGKILIEARRFIDYFQEQGMDADEVAVSVGIKNLSDAEANGHDIEIPAGQYLAKIAPTNHHSGLVRDLKNAPDQMSANEAQIVREKMVKEVKELQDLQAKEDPEAARQDAEYHAIIKERLIEGGYSPEAAEFKAMILVGIPNLARRAGRTDIEAFQEERFGGIMFTTNAQMRADKENVDLFVDPYLDLIRAGDFPSQRSIFGADLIERIRASGGLPVDPELTARDMAKNFRGLIREGGRSLDDIAEILHEEGYIAQRDPELVVEALDRVAAGEDIFGTQAPINEKGRELRSRLLELENIIEQNAIDIANMSNAEVRAALDAIETYFQSDEPIDTTELTKLTELVFSAAQHDPQMLARAQALLPKLATEQDFGDISFTEDYTLAGTTYQLAATRTFNKEFEMASERKDTLKALKDCLGG
ncbi:MAG: hypothetical protein GQ577_03890 [Woeseiaceae bacterium]|nr:hypothetical protein [Woeseiaceae bacterium]